MSLILDAESSAFHHKVNHHFLDRHVGLVVLHDLPAVHLGDRIDIGCKALNILLSLDLALRIIFIASY